MGRLKLLFPYLVLTGVVAAVFFSNLRSEEPASRVELVAAEGSAPESICPGCGMKVDPDAAPSATVDGRTRFFCGTACRKAFLAEAAGRVDASPLPAAGGRLVDVVCRMEVNAAWGIRSDHAGRTYYFCAERCKTAFDADPAHYLTEKCIVCDRLLSGETRYPASYLGKTYSLCTAEHRAQFKRDPAAYFMHTMWGIPKWLYYASIALVLVVSFGVFDWLGRRSASPADRSPPDFDENTARAGSGPRGPAGGRVAHARARSDESQSSAACGLGATGALALPVVSTAAVWVPRRRRERRTAPRTTDRFDLLSIRWIRAALRSRVFRFALQAVFVVAFLVIIAAGLFGNQNPAMNIAPILTWTIWWALLIVLILFAGKAWCYVCPWDAIAGWAERCSFWKKADEALSLGLRWPRIIRNISLATILFVGLTWIELGFGVTMRPRVTAYLAVAMLLMAVLSAMLFNRKSFCRYGCLVGRVSGLYALFAGTEVRPRKRDVCDRCRTKECVKGSETAYGCPTFLYPGKLETNTYCIQCMECIQACPHDNLAVNLRPWGSDLAVEGRPRTDEAYLALLMLSITGFHGLTMTPGWHRFTEALRDRLDLGRVVGFSLGMLLLMLAPIAVYAGLVAISRWLGRRDGAARPLSYRDYFIRYAYALLPIALFYHIAHNLEHLLMEGPKVLALASDPFGWNWNLFGTAHWTVPPMISLDKLWLVQVFLVLVGHVYSLWVAQKTSLRLFGSSRAALRSQLPMLLGMIGFSVFSLWLLKQPMEMRTSAM
ncbi:MAG: YHS domain-containing protein [Phycisphaerae bacterium]